MSVQIHTLSNGFRVVTENMPGLKSASVGIWVTAGGRHERIEQNGIAHFLEHMAFKGTKTRSALDIAEAIENVGGYMNAYTSREMTAYYARVLEQDVSLAVDVISDILMNPVFDPREIEVERGVILQEIGQALDTPDDIIFDWLQEEAYPDQALGRAILGTTERVSGFTRDHLTGFVNEHYGPDQMILAAAGAIDHDALVAQVETLFSGLQPRNAAGSDVAKYRGGERHVVKDLEQAHLTLGFQTPGYRDPAIYTAQLLSGVWGGSMSSRLFQEIREKRGLCYTIFSQVGAHAETGLMTIYAGTGAQDVGDLQSITMDELKRSLDDMNDAEIERARAQMKAGMLMGLESPSNRAERLARMMAIWGRVPTVDEIVAKIDAVTTKGTRDFASQLLAGNPTLVVYGPESTGLSLEAIRERLAA